MYTSFAGDIGVTILISYLVGLKGCRVGIVGEIVELKFGGLQIELKSLLSKQSVLLTIKV